MPALIIIRILKTLNTFVKPSRTPARDPRPQRGRLGFEVLEQR
jgi:hypothetical protein